MRWYDAPLSRTNVRSEAYRILGSRILNQEEVVVHVFEPLPTTSCFACHGPSYFPCCPITKLHVLFVFRFVGVRRNVAWPCCPCSLRYPSIFLHKSHFSNIFWKLYFSARIAPRNQNARVAPARFKSRGRSRTGSPRASPAEGLSALFGGAAPFL